MSDPKVTIAVPSYNHARFLPAALESALSQTYRNIEIIIVDDGSTDDSLKIAETYARRHPSVIKVFVHPDNSNLGISATVNECFKRSTGEYFSGLPSDDLLAPDKIEQQIEYFRKHPEVGWVYSHGQYVDQEDKLLPGLAGSDISEEPIEHLILVNSVPGMSVLARRDCFESVGPHTEGLVYSDWEFWIRMAAQSKAGFISKRLIYHRVHSYNTSIGIEPHRNLEHSMAVLDSLRQNAATYPIELTSPGIQLLIELQRARYCYCLARTSAASEFLLFALENYARGNEGRFWFDYWLRSPHPFPERLPLFFDWLIDRLRLLSDNSLSRKLSKRLESLIFARATMDSYAAGDFRATRRYATKSLLANHRSTRNRELIFIFLESLFGSQLMGAVRRFKRGLAAKLTAQDLF